MSDDRRSLVEVRLLEGPNLYFPRAACKVTLDLAAVADVPDARAREVARLCGLSRARPGAAGTAVRQAFLLRVVKTVARRLADETGVKRLALRTRAGAGTTHVVLAFPWRSSGRAQVFGHEVAALLDAAASDDATAEALVEARTEAAARVRSADRGRGPQAVRPRIPVASITGTNGKTTTTRLLAHLCMTAGFRTAWSSTDGVVVQGELVEPGDYSGPAGGRSVLAAEGVQMGILETARGGMLLKGMGVVANDVSVVTNVSADHLGQQGIDTVDQLAEVKAIVTHVTKPTGWTVLNGDDPRVLAMRAGSPGRPFVFSLDAESPALREALGHGGRALTVMDGALTVLEDGTDPLRLVDVLDMPVTLCGLSEHNVANAMAAAAAGLGLGLPVEAVVEGLRTFTPDAEKNPGRMNTFTVPLPLGAPAAERTGSCTAIIDLAHNEAGLEALLEVARGLVRPGSRLVLGLGGVGDRTDEILQGMGEMAGIGADRVAVVHKARYLRGKTPEELETLLRAGAAAVGVLDVPSYPTEVDGLRALLGEAGDGDVVALMSHAEREGVYAVLDEVGAVPDGAAQVRAKVVAARGLHERENEIAAARALPLEEGLVAYRQLHAEYPHDGRLAYEHACAHDRLGLEAEAIPLYREALAGGLLEPHRTSARVGLASSLRVVGEPAAALEVLDELAAERPDSTAGPAFRALVLHDLGRTSEAVAVAVEELSRHLAGSDAEGYDPALRYYADELRTAGRPGSGAGGVDPRG